MNSSDTPLPRPGTKTYPYAANAAALGALLCLGFLLAPACYYHAGVNRSAWLVGGVLRLDAARVSRIEIVAAFIFAAAALGGLVLIALVKRLLPRVLIESDALSMPSGRLGIRDTRFPFAAIHEVSVRTLAGRRMLVLRHATGSQVILESCLESPADFDEIAVVLRARIAPRPPIRSR